MPGRTLTAVLAGVLALGVGCAATRVESVWEAPNLQQLSVGRALVVGMMREETARRAYETRLVQRLRARGIPAEESFRYVGIASDLTRENLRPLTQKHGFDGVFVGRVTEVREQKQTVPADTWSAMDAWGFYNYGWYDSRQVTEVQVVNMETRLYRVAAGAGELIWSAVSESFDPTSSTEMAKKVADGVARRVTQDVTFQPEQGVGGSGPTTEE